MLLVLRPLWPHLRLYSTLLPQTREPVPTALAPQGNRSEPQLAPLRHGSLTPARIARGRPPCLVPIPPGAGTGRKYHCPWRESLRYSLPSAVLWTDGTALHLTWPSLMQIACTGGPGASSNVACPFWALSGRYSDDWIFSYQCECERLILFQPSLYIAEKLNACTGSFKSS